MTEKGEGSRVWAVTVVSITYQGAGKDSQRCKEMDQASDGAAVSAIGGC